MSIPLNEAMLLGLDEASTAAELDRYADEGVRALRRFNEELARGGRFRATMIPTEEGLALGVKIR